MDQEGTITANIPASETSVAADQPDATESKDSRNQERPRIGAMARIGEVLAAETRNLQLRIRFLNIVLFFCPQLCFNRLRTRLYRLCGLQIGFGTLIIGNLTLSGGSISSRLRIGRGCVLNAPLHFDLSAEIAISDEVYIGHHVVFITSDHELGPSHHRCGFVTARPISIGHGCWIGARATILPGVTIGAGSVVSAGAVVGADVPPNKLVAGNPARPVKSLD
jgi:maltose O-acetyltransferase